MTSKLPSLANARWLADPAVRRVFAVLESAGEEARVIGGAVRNALMDLPVADVDFGTTAPPDAVMAAAEAAGLKAVPTGFDHGTVTLVVNGRGFEVTTLREDIETDGRHAIVRFGRDWRADARRRDFTVNALSVDASGAVHDPVGGHPDIVARRIRFIGDPDRRIAEDRLRVLRLFRFQAEYGAGDIDAGGLAAATRAREHLRDLSPERIGQEMRRLVVAPRAAETVALMQEAGILSIVLGGIAYLGPFACLAAIDAPMSSALALAVLACRVDEDALRITPRLRLANAERDRIRAILAAAAMFRDPPDTRGARAALYRLGLDVYRDAVAYGWSWSGAAADDAKWRDLLALPERWTAPALPLGGRDLMAEGLQGPAVGETLRALETWWIGEDFAPDAAALRARLQQMLAVVP